MGLLVGIGRGQIVVFAGVDDNSGIGIDHAGKELVEKSPPHVDVTEDNPVHGVVEHHIQPFQCSQDGNFRHAQARAVVCQVNIASHGFARLIKRAAHQPEILLGGIGTAEAFGCRAVRNIVQQALACSADHGDDVGALMGRGGCLLDVLIDVAGGDDQIELRRRPLAQPLNHLFALPAVGGNFATCLASQLQGFILDCLAVAVGFRQHQSAAGNCRRNFLRRRSLPLHRRNDRHHCTLPQQILRKQMFHDDIDQGSALGIDAVNAE